MRIILWFFEKQMMRKKIFVLIFLLLFVGLNDSLLSNLIVPDDPFASDPLVRCLFVIAIRFIGNIVTIPHPNAAAAVRCEIFEHVTLPSLISAIGNAPNGSVIRVMIINETSILEPSCFRVINSAKRFLKEKLLFSSRRNIFLVSPTLFQGFDFLFFSRLDTDDAFSSNIFRNIQNTFLQSGLPIAVLSPLYVSLWYATSTKSGAFPCGEIIYSSISRNFQIMQTTAISLRQYVLTTGSDESTAIDWLKTTKAMPYNFAHEKPQEAIERVAKTFSICKISSDCQLFLHSWVDGASGFVYTQTGLQNSYQTTRNPTERLKFYDERLVKRRPGFPAFCDFIQQVGVNISKLGDLQRSIARFNGVNGSAALQAIQTLPQHSLLPRKKRDSVKSWFRHHNPNNELHHS